MKYNFVIWIVFLGVEFASLNSQANPSIRVNEQRPKHFRIDVPEDYEKCMPPKHNGMPVVVDININPLKILDISLDTMGIQIIAQIVAYWSDHRINMTSDSQPSQMTIFDLLPPESNILWKPIIGIRNAISEDILIPTNIKYFETRLMYIVRKTSMYHCDFDLANYPMDRQECRMEVQALNYKSSVILRNHVRVYDLDSNPSEYIIHNIKTGNCSTYDKLSNYYSCVMYSIQLYHRVTRYLLQSYLPSGLLVILSWGSFWLDDIKGSAPRIALGITTLLTLMKQFISIQESVPKSGHLMAIDVWMLTCIFMVTASMMEFIVAYFRRKAQPIPTRQKFDEDALIPSSESDKTTRGTVT